MDFSTILQTPEVRAIVQQNLLERAFHDALFPRLLYRAEATPQVWPAHVGDSMVFTGVGLIPPKMKPLVPGTDPSPSSYPAEQWTAQLQQYADSIDTAMPTSIAAIADLFLRNAHQLGMSAGQTLNRVVRDRMYDAALDGWTVVNGTDTGLTTSLPVQRLNGFTRARNPSLPSGSAVRFDPVSTSNPLSITINSDSGPIVRSVVGFTADNPGDEVGPGTLTLTSAGSFNVTDRAYVLASDRSYLVRVGGGNRVDDITSSNILRLQDIRSAVAHFRQQNVPAYTDGYYHCHFDPVSEAQIYADSEWQRLLTSLPDYYMYKDFAIGQLLGVVYFRNTESPIAQTVLGGGTDFSTETFDVNDPFPGEVWNPNDVPIHRPLFTAQGGIYEYYQDLMQLITEAGVTGKVGAAQVVNNGIEVNSDRIQLIIRAPLNRLQDQVATSWKFIGDWPIRTDATTGDSSRYKRFLAIEHGA